MMSYIENTQYYKLMQEGMSLESNRKFKAALSKYEQAYKIASKANDSAADEAHKRISVCKKQLRARCEAEEFGM